MAPPIFTTGYYRYTDIVYEWYNELAEPSDRFALKAMLAPEALTSPESPLKKPGHEGLEMWLGAVANGESRLCFSSAQIEYIRYFLFATGTIKTLFPLPSSHYLLTSSTLRNISPIYYKSASALKSAVKNISKNNKKLKGSDPLLGSLRSNFELVRASWASKAGVWCAIDFEAWEMKHDDILEFGYSIYRWDDGNLVGPEDGHWTVKERRSYRNSKYIVDNKDYFQFGRTIEKPLKTFTKHIQDLVAKNNTPGPLFLVFHDAHGDLQYLRQLKVPEVDTSSRQLPSTTPTSGVFVVDTGDLFGALEGQSSQRRNLERMCRLLGIKDCKYMHNAGNDAHFTLIALEAMAAGPPLDMQREERWPSAPPADPATLEPGAPPAPRPGLTVIRPAYDEEDDYSDTEGML